MAPPPKTPERLDRMVDHVHYEASQLTLFSHVGNGWVLNLDGAEPVLAWFAAQSMLEAALAHLRNLIEFLYTSAQDDRVGAGDYVVGWKHNGTAPWGDYAQLQARLAHIGLDRASVVSDGAFDWSECLQRSAPVVLAEFRRFLLQVPEPQRSRMQQPAPDALDLLELLPAAP